MLPVLRESSTPTYAPGTIDRRSATYIRWVQQSLNTIDRAGLVVDGIIGPKTRDAIKRFQTRAGVAADGVVGPVTEAALIRAGAGQPPRSTTPGTGGSGSSAVTAQFTPGPGLYSYKPASQQWGTPETVRALGAIGAAWQRSQPGGPRIGIGDLSLRGGGPMSGHASHQLGLDIDIRPVRNDRREEPTNYRSSSYSRTLTQQLVDIIRSNGVLRVQYIFFNDPQVRGVSNWPNHDDHLHVRFYPPGSSGETDWEDEWIGEIDRRGPAYMRWVQQSLNQVDNAGLVVDGIKGPRTTAAVRRFQQRSGLVPDGIVGPRTEAALIAAGAPRPDALPTPPTPSDPPFVPPTPIDPQQCLNRCREIFERCTRNSTNAMQCLAELSACLRACGG
jgi:peptidoglycan hydrolase-like protein with peptidoglycan-binding domain